MIWRGKNAIVKTMKISREKLIRFYDERINGNDKKRHGSHVSALTGLWGEDLLLGILQHYWKNIEKTDSTIRPESCGPGTKKGHRLDAWLLKGKTLYQVEVKNWAAYSLKKSEWKSNELKFDAPTDQIEKYCMERWHYYFNAEEIPDECVAKVLKPMKKPEGCEIYEVKSLLCFWFFISESIEKPYSTRTYGNGNKLDVFSASAYLRSLKDDAIEIAMPRAEGRLKLLFGMIVN
jgi:hypothetical protein